MILTQHDATTGAGGKVGERVSGGQGQTSFLAIDLPAHFKTRTHTHTHTFNVMTHEGASVHSSVKFVLIT